MCQFLQIRVRTPDTSYCGPKRPLDRRNLDTADFTSRHDPVTTLRADDAALRSIEIWTGQ